MTYKVGCESLNLVEANHIILMEPWWCPTVVEQAKARVHRIGQNEEVIIYELAVEFETERSIEQRICSMCEEKVKMATEYLRTGMGSKHKGGLSASEMGSLIR